MTPEEVVDAFYAAAFAGDGDAALALTAPDGQYHPFGAIEDEPIWRWGPGPLPLRVYATEILPDFAEAVTDYAITSVERDTLDGLVVSRMRTSLGSGVMVFRVEDEKLTDIWVVPSRGRLPNPVF